MENRGIKYYFSRLGGVPLQSEMVYSTAQRTLPVLRDFLGGTMRILTRNVPKASAAYWLNCQFSML